MITNSYKVLIDSWFQKKGMARHENLNGATVCWLHHSAAPAKDNAWAEDFSKTFPGGRRGGPWRSEMDGDADAYAGGRVFPDFSIPTHVIPQTELPDEWPCWRVIDPGLEHALACLWFKLDPYKRMLIQVDEHVQAGWTEVERHAQIIKGKSRKWNIQYTLIDPSAFAKTLAGGGTSVADLFTRCGIPVCPAYRAAHKRDQIPALAELFRLKTDGEPSAKAMDNCAVSIGQLLKYRWKPKLHDDKSSPEEPVKVDDDCVDAWLYAAAALDPVGQAKTALREDRLAPWYFGRDRKRQQADERRIQATIRNEYLETEP